MGIVALQVAKLFCVRRLSSAEGIDFNVCMLFLIGILEPDKA